MAGDNQQITAGLEWHAMGVELTIARNEGGEHFIETNHFPSCYRPLSSSDGWVDDFPTMGEIVGQPVHYRVAGRLAVELDSALPALASSGWSFPNYLG